MLSTLKALVSFVVLTVSLGLSAADYTEGMQLSKRGAPEWNLEQKLGSGYFGDVFRVSDVNSQEHRYAAKVFKDKNIGSRALDHYSYIFEFFQKHGNHPNIVNVGIPEVYDAPGGGRTTVLFFELQDGSVESLIERFRPNASDSPLKRRNKFKQIARLKQDIVEAISFLYIHGVSHYDINPRNILVDGNRFLLGDLDSLAPSDTVPMSDAWEKFYAPPEWSDGQKDPSYTLTHLGDVWSLASVLYFILFENTPLQDYFFNVAPQKMTRGELRRGMREHPENHYAFDAMVANKLDAFRATLTNDNGVFETDYANMASVLNFIQAGLQRDLLDRQIAVVQTIPTFAIKRNTGCWASFGLPHAM